ncbi:hypothetical protein BH11PLA2_BH11PLA2_51610 [soil metagenome]
MQSKSEEQVRDSGSVILTARHRANSAVALLISVLALATVGCPSNTPPPTVTVVPKPFAGMTLKIGGMDTELTKALYNRAQGWATRNDAKIILVTEEAADVTFVTPAVVGIAAALDLSLSVPEELKTLEHPGQWIRILPVDRDRLSGWVGEPRAFPVSGEGAVLVLRTDLLSDPAVTAKHVAKFGKTLPALPGTWDDIAEIAETFAELNKAALPRETVLSDFLRVAACNDRVALAESDLLKTDSLQKSKAGMLSFLHDAASGEPRLTTPGFVAAAAWTKRVQPGRTQATVETVTALSEGKIVMAVLTLAELARLPKEAGQVAKQFAVAPLPGSRSAFDSATQTTVDFSTRTGGNYVPYFSAGTFGLVRKQCVNAAAAWDLLADLGGPARSLELLSETRLGCGPFRAEHLEQSREMIWQRYGFDAERTTALADALRRSIAVAIANPALTVRSTDASELMKLLEKSVTAAASGTLSPAAAMEQANDAWKQHDARIPQAKEWRRRSAGLN